MCCAILSWHVQVCSGSRFLDKTTLRALGLVATCNTQMDVERSKVGTNYIHGLLTISTFTDAQQLHRLVTGRIRDESFEVNNFVLLF